MKCPTCDLSLEPDAVGEQAFDRSLPFYNEEFVEPGRRARDPVLFQNLVGQRLSQKS
jgi:hypothetical protein